MPRKQKEQTPTTSSKKKTKEKSPKKSEDPKMDEDEINRLMQNALDKAMSSRHTSMAEPLMHFLLKMVIIFWIIYFIF